MGASLPTTVYRTPALMHSFEPHHLPYPNTKRNPYDDF